jgi:catechol 2,3-dioxygenase-like lactoylglutathione lyase family enzyme
MLHEPRSQSHTQADERATACTGDELCTSPVERRDSLAPNVTSDRGIRAPVATEATVVGLHHIRLPVSDVLRSRDWYSTVFDFEPCLSFEEEDRLLGVVLIHQCGLTLGLHHAPERARSLRGFCSVALSVGSAGDLDDWCARLDELAIAHTSPTEGHLGRYVEVHDPDGLIIQLHTDGQPSADEA